MTNEQIAEKVLNDVFRVAGSGRPADIIPMAVFSSAMSYVALQVLPDDMRAEVNRQIQIIRKIMDDKMAERASTVTVISTIKGDN